jgi:glycosyltransferase involved in cell wall biosynthesis
VHNGERFIAAAIASVLEQTVAVTEIIVVDDGSTDATAARVAEFGDAVTYVRQVNQGPVVARNAGIGRASGRYIALLDADDLWQPEKTARQLARLEDDPQLGACTTFMQNFWMADVAAESTDAANARLTAPQPGVASTFMARSSVFEDVGPFDESLKHRDVQDWLVRAQTRGWRIDTLPETLVRRRIHDSNCSRQRSDHGEQELLRLALATIAQKRRAG